MRTAQGMDDKVVELLLRRVGGGVGVGGVGGGVGRSGRQTSSSSTWALNSELLSASEKGSYLLSCFLRKAPNWLFKS